VCDRLRRAQQAAQKKGIRWRPQWLKSAAGIGASLRFRRWAHISGRLCLDLASGMQTEKADVAQWARWPLRAGEAALVAFLSFRIEATALLRAAFSSVWAGQRPDDLEQSARPLVQGLRAAAATATQLVQIGPAARHGPGTVEVEDVSWEPSVWSDTADVLQELAEKRDPSVVEDRRLPALVAASGLLSGEISLTEPNSNTAVEAPRGGAVATQRRSARAWARLLATSCRVEELTYRILTGYETCDAEEETEVVAAIIAGISAIRSVQFSCRRHGVIAERFKHVGESLKVRRRHSKRVSVVRADSILRFPVHHFESFPGEPVSLDFSSKGAVQPHTVCLVPSDLRDWFEVRTLRTCVKRLWQRYIWRHIVWFALAGVTFGVPVMCVAWSGIPIVVRVILGTVGGLALGITAGMVANAASEWLKRRS